MVGAGQCEWTLTSAVRRFPKPAVGYSCFSSIPIVRKLCRAAACWFSVCLIGCTESAKSVAARNAATFRSAPTEARAAWDIAAAAAKTNGYFTAMVVLEKIQSDTTLSVDQQQAIKQFSTTLSDQMYDAANKGNPAATEAIQELHKLRSR